MELLKDSSGDWGHPEDAHYHFMTPVGSWIDQKDCFFDFISAWNTYGHTDWEHWERGRIYKKRLYDEAQSIAKSLYEGSYPGAKMEAELRFQPHVGVYYIPHPDNDLGNLLVYFVFKFDNNGTSIVIHHQEEGYRIKNPLPEVIVGYVTEDKKRLSK